MSTHDLVDGYVLAVSEGDFDVLFGLIYPDASFNGTVAREANRAEAFRFGVSKPLSDHSAY